MSSDNEQISCLFYSLRLDVTRSRRETRTLYYQTTPLRYQSVSLAYYTLNSCLHIKCDAFVSHQCTQASSAVSIYVTVFRDNSLVSPVFDQEKHTFQKLTTIVFANLCSPPVYMRFQCPTPRFLPQRYFSLESGICWTFGFAFTG